ncbi:MAG: DUF5654 family protein [bacterium]|nr:DUF5654 family protein [bacterium]
MIDRIKKTQSEIRGELREKTLGYIVTALGLVAGLAWNEAIKASIEYTFPLTKDTIQAKFIYAGVITVLIGLLTYVLSKLLGSKK